MKENKLFFGVLLFSMMISNLVGDNAYPLVALKLTISDESNNLLSDVNSKAYCHQFPNGDNANDIGSSNEGGVCMLTLRALGFVDVVATKKGYYPSISRSDRPPRDERLRFDPFIYRDDIPRRDQRDPPMKKEVKLEASIALREVKNPIPLYAKSVRMDIPARDVWLAYDLEVGDWVRPHGKGVKSDMRIRSAPKILTPENDDLAIIPGVATLEIDFGEGGGLVRVTEKNGWLAVSEMKMPHLAPEAGYEKLPALKIEQKNWNDSSEMEKAKGYFFRTRVQREGGKVASAHYGKLWGGITYTPVQRDRAWFNNDKKNIPIFGSVEFIYYFNPKPNDRNLEFDMKKNLLNRLAPGDGWERP